MKHVNALSNQKPVLAQEEVAWVSFKNIFGTLPITGNQATWLVSRIDQSLQK